MINPEWLKLKDELTETLHNNILKYWINNTIDKDNSGFVGHINFDNTKKKYFHLSH